MMMGPGFHASPTVLPSQANTSELGRRQFNRHLRSFPPSTCDLSARSGYFLSGYAPGIRDRRPLRSLAALAKSWRRE